MYQLLKRLIKALPAIILSGLSLTLLPTATSADELIMRDGSRILGEVVGRSNGTLEFKTEFAGTLKIKWSKVAELQTDKPMEFLLEDDKIVKVTKVTNSVNDMIIEGAAASGLPPQTLGQSMVASINPEPWQKGEGYKFSGIVNFLFERERGNTDQDELDWDGNLTLRSEKERYNLFGEWEKEVNNNDTTKRKWKLEGSYNYFLTKQWYTGAFSRLEHDKFADLDLRSTAGPLVGYQWYESNELNISTATGVSYVDENFIEDTDNDDSYVALPWSINFDKMLFDEFVQVYHKQIGFWNIEDTGDVVWDPWTGLRFPLTHGIVATTEFKLEIDTGAAEDASEYDSTYTLKLGYQW